MKTPESPPGPGRKITQARSRKTYEAFVATGFRLIEKHELESITVAGLSEAAGYSVGAFYARFESKDEFLEAMVAKHIRERSDARKRILAEVTREELVGSLIGELVRYYWRRRRFWRAVLMRSAHDPEFWVPINQSAREFTSSLIARMRNDAGRELTDTEIANIRFAIQMVLGMINNRIVNRPRPSLVGHSTFVRNLVRAFRLVADYDRLMSGAPSAAGA